MDFITQIVGQAPSRELPPGVLRVHTDGKRIYDEAFKADLVRQCQVPDISVAAMAMAHGINANLLRRWIGQRVARGALVVSPPALLPVKMSVTDRDGEVRASKTNRSALGGPPGRCRRRRRTGGPGQ